jgi:hypothetical protein
VALRACRSIQQGWQRGWPYSRTVEGKTIMALGFNYTSGGGGDIIPFVKFDARAGRLFRRDRSQDSSGNYISNDEDITNSFKAVIDLENIEVGYLKFGAGSAPEYFLVPLGTPMPHKPADAGFKQGARIMLKLASACGGDVREISGNSSAFLKGVDELHTAYEAGKAANAGKLPIVVLKTTIPITSGSGQKKSTNYQPVFEIAGWAPRPVDLVHVAKGSGGQAQQPAQTASPSAAPSTGSTQVGAPQANPAKRPEMAEADDFG